MASEQVARLRSFHRTVTERVGALEGEYLGRDRPLGAISAEDASSPAARWCIQQYFAELGERFDTGFDPARSIPADARDMTPPHGLLLIARLREQPVGCGALNHHPGAPTELKRMWVDPGARGLGLGRRLLRELEREAVEAGASSLRLE